MPGPHRVHHRLERAVLANVGRRDEVVEAPDGEAMIGIIINAAAAFDPRMPEVLARHRMGNHRVHDLSAAFTAFSQGMRETEALRHGDSLAADADT